MMITRRSFLPFPSGNCPVPAGLTRFLHGWRRVAGLGRGEDIQAAEQRRIKLARWLLGRSFVDIVGGTSRRTSWQDGRRIQAMLRRPHCGFVAPMMSVRKEA
jgi:hypothetical protein